MSRSNFSPARLTRADFEARVALVAAASESFPDLVAAAGLRPEADLRFGDFSTCQFDGDDLRRFDFTGCDLSGATFARARILGARFDGARLDLGALRVAADYDAFLKADLTRKGSQRYRPAPRRLRDFAVFREAPFAPEMIVLPAGEFKMGSDIAEEKLEEDDEALESEIAPGVGKRPMRIAERFGLGRYPVAFEEYDVFCGATGRDRPPDEDWGRDRRPAINVSWYDAQAYIAWLNDRLGTSAYRLPSEAQWEYACRAGTETRRWWGPSWDLARANGDRSFEGGRTSPVDHFKPNPWGLHDMIGNVWEWCADEWADNIALLPEDGSPFHGPGRQEKQQSGRKRKAPRSPGRALRGGSWGDDPGFLRSAFRYWGDPVIRGDNVGFRLSRTL